MKKLMILLLATAVCWEVNAQRFEELTSWEQTLKGQLSLEQLQKQFHAHRKELGLQPNADDAPSNSIGATMINSNWNLEILPDTLYAGEPFDVHCGVREGSEGTYELYDLRGKRPKRMVTKRASTNINGSTVFRITIDEPGNYRIVAYDESMLIMYSNPEEIKSRWDLTVHDRKSVASE